jgi:hypothetical protein
VRWASTSKGLNIVPDGLAGYSVSKARGPELAAAAHRCVRDVARLNNCVEHFHQPPCPRER